jgi:zinc D-Ala-D-Ala carboxypeptidase
MDKFFKRLILFLLLAAGLVTSFEFIYQNIKSRGNINNPSDQLVLVNKSFYLPKNYIPEDLITPNVRFKPYVTSEKKMMRHDAAKALESMLNRADKEEIKLYCVSGYRSYESQQKVYIQKLTNSGLEKAQKYVALPGHSEHQTGLAMDIANAKGSNGELVEDFGNTKEGKWLKNNAHKFGFIIRYPEGKEDITGYNYEPWHVRYVGIKEATQIKNYNLTLEEFLEYEL